MIRKRPRGFTLLELMVATGVSSIVVAGVFFMMTNQTQVNQKQGEIIEMQQGLRGAMTLVRNNIELAGFNIPGRLTVGLNDGTNAVDGLGSKDNVAANDSFKTCPNTDVLQIRYRHPVGFWQVKSGTVEATLRLDTGVSNTASIGGKGYHDEPWPAFTMLLIVPAYPRHARAFPVKTMKKRDAFTLPDLPLQTPNWLKDYAEVGNEVTVMRSLTYRVVCANDAAGVEKRTLVVNPGVDLNEDGNVTYLDAQPIASDVEDFQVEFLYDKTGGDNNQPDDLPEIPAPTDPVNLFPTSQDEVIQIKAIRIAMVGRTARPMDTTKFVSEPFNLRGGVAWPTKPSSPPYDVRYRYGRRLLSEQILLINRNTRNAKEFSPIPNKNL